MLKKQRFFFQASAEKTTDLKNEVATFLSNLPPVLHDHVFILKINYKHRKKKQTNDPKLQNF